MSSAPPSPFTSEPVLEVAAADGATLAVFGVRAAGADATSSPPPGSPSRLPLLLIHGAGADHTTFRVVGPILARSRRVFAVDRRGRGASTDGSGYAIEREFRDVLAVARAIAEAEASDGGVDLVGHSYGGRCALGAVTFDGGGEAASGDSGISSGPRRPIASSAPRAIRRVVAYEGAPVPPAESYRPPGLLDEMRRRLAAGEPAAALDAFLSAVVGMSPEALDAYHREPVWPARVAATHTIVREVEAESSTAASLDALAHVDVPVLLILGSASRDPFRIGTDALAARLPTARVVVIEGAAHAAHHTHPDAFVAVVESFLDA